MIHVDTKGSAGQKWRRNDIGKSRVKSPRLKSKLGSTESPMYTAAQLGSFHAFCRHLLTSSFSLLFSFLSLSFSKLFHISDMATETPQVGRGPLY